MSLISILVCVSALVASSVGCRTELAPGAEGRLDVVIRPDGAVASGRPVQGSLVLRDQDGHCVDRLAVASPYETLSVALLEGAYALEWQPLLSFDWGVAAEAGAEAAATAAREAGTFAAAPVLIRAGRVTTLDVRAALAPGSEAELAALDEEIPSVDILIARH